ncbi:MAG TPA: EamA family transporter [Candidatus Dormibacteraeota bacterium]|jgi:drug/metabolite transporter (DMT)-like permease|nr:EamA family transporter [Candidatus Dormibacteraeota bacterium]
MAALLALVSAVCYGVSDFSGGLAARRVAATAVVLVSNGLSLLLALLAVGLLPGSTFTAGDMAWGAAAGIVGLLGVVLLYRGLAIGPMSVVAPLTAVLSALVPVAVGTIRGERPGTLAVVGVALAIPAMVLLGREPRRRPEPESGGRAHRGSAPLSRGAVVSALSAGIGFGGFFVLLAQTSAGGGAWPLVPQRAASVLILLAVSAATAVRASPILPRGRTLALAAIAGVTDFAANLAYVLATHHGLLALVAVISSLYPASTLLLARGVLGERLARQQAGGLVVAAVAVALIALH